MVSNHCGVFLDGDDLLCMACTEARPLSCATCIHNKSESLCEKQNCSKYEYYVSVGRIENADCPMPLTSAALSLLKGEK